MPDYTKQLDEIVRLLSRPGVSPWVLSAFAAFLGVIGGALGRGIEPWIVDVSRRKRLRRVLYSDIATLFFHVDTITTFGEPWANDTVRDEAFRRLSDDLDFEAEEYINTNRDVFMQLGERPAAKHIYSLLHRVSSDGAAHMKANCDAVQWMLGHYIRNNTLRETYFRKFLPTNQVDRLLKRAIGIYDESCRREQERQKENEKHLS